MAFLGPVAKFHDGDILSKFSIKINRYLLLYGKKKFEDVITKHRYFDLKTHQKSNAIRIKSTDKFEHLDMNFFFNHKMGFELEFR